MNISDYIKSLGFDHLSWRFDLDEDSSAEHYLIITNDDERFWLYLATGTVGSFLTNDDLSWCGPVRNVVAWAPIEIRGDG